MNIFHNMATLGSSNISVTDSQIQVILLKIAKRHVLSPVPDGWQSLRQANFNIDVELVIVFL